MDILMRIVKSAVSFTFNLQKAFPCCHHEVRRNTILTATTQSFNEVVTIERIKPITGEEIVISWGDKTTTTVTEDTSNLEHTYVLPKEYKVQVDVFLNLEILYVTEDKWSLDSRNLVNCTNLKELRVFNSNSGYFNTSNLEDMSMTLLELKDLGNSFRTIIKSENFSNWDLSNFVVESVGSNQENLVIFNSSDVATWTPSTFVLLPDDIQTYSEFNSSDISAWSPSWFRISNMDGEFNSSDMSLWTGLDIFNMYDMKETLTGSFSLGETVFASTNIFVLRDMPSTYEITIPSSSLSNWLGASHVNLVNNSFTEGEVDTILEELYTGYSTRTEYNGEIYIAEVNPIEYNQNENAEPSGIYRASATPSTGKEYAYELLYDSEVLNSGHEWDIVSIKNQSIILSITTEGDNQYSEITQLKPVDGTSFILFWGDGESEVISQDTYNLSHTYASIGTYEVVVDKSLNLEVLVDSNISIYMPWIFDSRNIVGCTNLKYLSIYDVGDYINSYDLRNMSIEHFELAGMDDSNTTIFKSEDLFNWNPTIFIIESIGNNVSNSVVFNSSDISSWNPTNFTFIINNVTASSGNFNSSDVALWNPSVFLIDGLNGAFNSSDISSWSNLEKFSIYNMKETATGSFDLSDVPYSLLTEFDLREKASLYEIVVPSTSLQYWTKLNNFSISNNSLSEAQVDAVLQEFYIGYPNRENGGGAVYIVLDTNNTTNENAEPSGVLQASATPSTGKEYAYELVNDSTGINPGYEWDEVRIKDEPIPVLPDALLYITTTEIDQYTEIAWITPVTGESLTIYWGDGTNDVVTEETFSLVHYYATPDTYEVTISNLVNLKQFAPSWMWVFDSSYLDVCVNLTDLNIIYTEAGIFDSYDLRNSPLVYFEMGWMGANFTTIIRSEDMYNWNIDSLRLNELGTNENSLIVMNSADISSWSPSVFQLEGYNMSAISGTFNSSDIALWSPTWFILSNVSGEFNSSDLAGWYNIEQFIMYDMQDDTTGTFSFGDIYPTIMEFTLKNKSPLYAISVGAYSFSGWSAASFVDLTNNGFIQSEVDTILQEFYIGLPSRYNPSGTILLDQNAEPSGIYQASSSPTTGKEYAYELVYDTEGLGEEWGTVSIETS